VLSIIEVSSSFKAELNIEASNINSVIFSHDSTRLALASQDYTVKIWNASSGACQTLDGHSSWVNSVIFSHDSTRLASASYDTTVKIWNVSSGACLKTLDGHSNWVNSVIFSHDSIRLASASWDNKVKIWNASSGACLQTLAIEKTLYIISFDKAGSYLHTEIGTIAINVPSASNTTPNITKPQDAQFQGLSLDSDKAWIKYNSEKVLWLPSEYRPSCSAVAAETLGIGVGSGKVWMCSLNVESS
jgi:WD40 repeat protein